MSEITHRTNINRIDEVNPVKEVHALMAKLNDMNRYKPLNLVLSGMQSFVPDDVLTAINAKSTETKFVSAKTTVCSPNLLRASFQAGFPLDLKNFESKGIPPLTARKAAWLSALGKMDFKIVQPNFIKANILAVIRAGNMKTLNNEMKTVMQIVEIEHTKVFVNNLAKACANASFNVGFKDIEIKKEQGKLEVIATNNIGQHLNSEISIDSKTNDVNANTETIGITDGSCTRIISVFNDELRKMGIKIGKEKTKFTGGIPQLSYSRLIEQMDKERQYKKKEFKRLIKLNRNRNQKQQY